MTAKSLWLYLIVCHNVFSVSAIGNAQDSGGPLLPEQAAYDVTYYELHLTIDPESRSISGFVDIHAVVLDDLSTFVVDLSSNFIVDFVCLSENEQALPFDYQEGRIWIDMPAQAGNGDILMVRVRYHGQPAEMPVGTSGMGFSWRTTRDGQTWAGVQCELDGADLWWPCKDHPSDEPDSVGLYFTVPGDLTCISNGKLQGVIINDEIDEGHAVNQRTYHWFVSTPINNYNVTFYLAPYRSIDYSYQSITGETISATVWVLPEHYDAAVSNTPQFLDHIRFLEETCGPYPFRADKYGVVESATGGMEHQTAIAIGSSFENEPRYGFVVLHLHELSHEWWGNMVTAKDWSDAWIHEGFATYMEALYAGHLGGLEAYHRYMDGMRRSGNVKPIAPRQPMTVRSIFSGDIYHKAAWVIHTLRHYLGDETFFQLLRRWAYPEASLESVTDGGQCRFATTDDFLRIAEDVTGMELDWFFEVYLRQTSLPTLRADFDDRTLLLRWETENDIPFPLSVQVDVGDSIHSVDMFDGTGELSLADNATPVIDPDGWILMDLVLEGIFIGGSEWVAQESGTSEELYSVHFVDENTGWIVGAGCILHTTDGGEKWIKQNSQYSSKLCIHCIDAEKGWTCGNDGLIFHTFDGGENWIQQPTNDDKNLTSIYFIDGNTGWAVGWEGSILKTVNGGIGWTPQNSETAWSLESVFFTDPETGWAGGYRWILKTTDGGKNWIQQFDSEYMTFNSVHFIDSNTGWAAGGYTNYGAIYHTSDGGENWNPQISGVSQCLIDVCFADANTGWAVGYEGTVLHTTDGGAHWSQPGTPFSERLTSVCLVNDQVGYVVGYKGKVFKINMPGQTAVDEGGDEDTPDDFLNLQNYPNPFNPSTTIAFDLSRPGFVSLKIYDLLGRQEETLVEEFKEAGNYRITWDAGDLPSGVYLCRLEIGGASETSERRLVDTKKLILQR